MPPKIPARYIFQRMGLFLIFAIILFLAAGKLFWFRAWVYLLSTLLLETCTLYLLAKKAPQTLYYRGVWSSGIKSYEKVFAIAWLVLSLVTPLVAGLEERFRPLPPPPVLIMYVGVVLLFMSSLFGAWAMVENVHFEQFMRIQVDRDHRVVTSGPYRIVRHPGYAGAVVGALCTPFILGSWWTLVPAGAVATLFILRTAFEDRTLRNELDGYEAYTHSTRYRLLPGIW